MIRRGIGVGSFVVGGYTPTDADALAFVNAAGISDDTQKLAINTLVTDLKAYSIWTKMKAIYPMVGGTSSTHKWNLKDPRDLDAAFRLVFNGGGTHSSTGYLPNGTNGFANTYLSPATSLTTSSGHFSYYSRSNPANAAQYEMGTSEVIGGIAVRFNAIISKFSNGLFYAAYGEYNATVSNSDSRGLFVTNRNSSTTTTGFKNGTKVITQTQTAALSTLPMYIGGENGNGTAVNFSGKECAFASIGDGLTDTEAANLSITVEKYQTTLGRSVNPWYDNGNLLLDLYPSASAAYSTRKLRNYYIGAAMRVRRSSDNAEQDIYFDANGNLDETALTTFVGVGNGFVTTWYDQSGNGNNATQSTAGNQPQIVASGSVIKLTGIGSARPVLHFTGLGKRFVFSSSISGSVFTSFNTSKYSGTSGTGVYAGSLTSGATPYTPIPITTAGYFMSKSGTTGYQHSTITNNYELLSCVAPASGTLLFYINNSSKSLTTITDGNSPSFRGIGTRPDLSVDNSYCNEFIIYTSDQSSNVTGINTNINTYYALY